MIVCVVYRPPSGNFSDFVHSFEEAVVKFHPSNSEVICGGVVNVDFFKIDDFRVLKLTEIFELFNFKQLVDVPTRVTKSSSTLIDIILLSVDVDGSDGVGQLSDHVLVYVKLNFVEEVSRARVIKSR